MWCAGRRLIVAGRSRVHLSLKPPWVTLEAATANGKQSQACGFWCASLQIASYSSEEKIKKPLKKPKTPQGRLDDEPHTTEKDPLQGFPDGINPITKERGGPKGPEPTRYGDWERKGRCIDF
ncbi:succinate dehydrogenase assembly factor 4, mitochondrial [Ambystoma mexicanum]|uniref:succinate dehydrogenase assembly factor 4, mitochondrial n=1 Tax=Ambystoma mexicanum TaxID=8296 RepID=UPI0037E8FF52